jgi:hypothetical protein
LVPWSATKVNRFAEAGLIFRRAGLRGSLELPNHERCVSSY